MAMSEETATVEVEGGGENPFISKWESFYKHACLKQIEKLVGEYPEKRSLLIDFVSIEHFDPELADELLANPDYVLEAAKMAITNIDVPALELEQFLPNIRVYNLPKDRQSLLRNIEAEHLNKLIAVEGIVLSMTEVRPKLKIATWECRRCGNTYKLIQTGQAARQPAVCECKHRDFNLVAEKSEFINHQKIQVQEPLELLKGSEQATILDVIILDDMVNKVAPGIKTCITGVLRLIQPKEKSIVYGKQLEAIHLEETAKEFAEVDVSKEEEAEIRKLAKDEKIYDKLVGSIAPAIYGHEVVKEAIVLQLFGGVKKMLPGNPSTRGNIHVLLVGDPGVAKSQLMQAVNNIAPKSIYVAGKTTTGVGLCVAPDSLVLNESGFRDIRGFVEERFEDATAREEIPGAHSNPCQGKTMPCLGEDLKLSEQPVSKIWRIKAPEKMYKIVTQSGRELSLTPATSLTRLKTSQVAWTMAEELAEGDYVAVPRRLPEGQRAKIPSIACLWQNKNIRVVDDLSNPFKLITDALARTHGSLQNVARVHGLDRESVYRWRMREFHHSMPLHVFVNLGLEAGQTMEWLAGHVTECFLAYGKTCKVPRYLDDERLAYVAGLLFGDGSIYLRDNSVHLRFYNNSQETLDRFDAAVRELFGLETEKLLEPGKVPGRRFNSAIAWKLFQAFGLSNRKLENRLSHLATEMPNNVLGALLSGLFETDGFVSDTVKASPSVGISTISKPLADTLQLALLKFGVLAKKRERNVAGHVAQGKEICVRSNNNQFYVEVRGKENLQAFKKGVGFRLERKRTALERVIARTGKSNPNHDLVPELKEAMEEAGALWEYRHRLSPSRSTLSQIAGEKKNGFFRALAESDVLWDRIARKEAFSPAFEHVYDVTVEGTHNFVANGFYVHNTATAVKDEFGEGGWTLKAGALVLASGGMAMIDEFDKMDPEDRSAMHEAMEQGMISVAKAGIVTRFKTETSILAAANPKYGRFDPYQNFMQQVDLPPTLISRFDLFFMIKDVLDREKDSRISAHILKTHQAAELLLQEKRGTLKKGQRKEIEEIQKIVTPAIDGQLLRKYISFARQNVFPALSREAIDAISVFYLDLREQGKKEGTYAATHRQLEAMVRLAEGSARVRLSDTIELVDAERAIRLFKTSLQELVMDKETGRIDIDLINIGQSQKQLENMKKVLNLVKSMSAELDMVPIEDIISEAKTEGIDADKVNEILNNLTKAGDIYRPRHGFVKSTEKK